MSHPSVRAVVPGRSAELAEIEDFLQRIRSGSGAILIQGEAGIGKTTLFNAVATVDVASSVAVGRGHTLCGFIAGEHTGTARFQP